MNKQSEAIYEIRIQLKQTNKFGKQSVDEELNPRARRMAERIATKCAMKTQGMIDIYNLVFNDNIDLRNPEYGKWILD